MEEIIADRASERYCVLFNGQNRKIANWVSLRLIPKTVFYVHAHCKFKVRYLCNFRLTIRG